METRPTRMSASADGAGAPAPGEWVVIELTAPRTLRAVAARFRSFVAVAALALAAAAAAAALARGCEREKTIAAALSPAEPRASRAADASDEPADTLSRVPTLPRLYDGDTTSLLPRWAEKLESGSKDGVHFAIERLGAARDAAGPEIARVAERTLRDAARC